MPGKQSAPSRGNTIVGIAPDVVVKMQEPTDVVTDACIEGMGENGQALYDSANELLEKYSR